MNGQSMQKNRLSKTALITVALFPALFHSAAFATTYYYGSVYNLPIPSPDAPEAIYGRGAMKQADFVVPEHHVIHDIDVYVGLTHSSIMDCEIAITSPAGTRIVLAQSGNIDLLGVGGRRQLIFDDSAAAINPALIKTSPIIFERPASPFTLSSLIGQDPFGTWKIQITDTMYQDTGTLDYLRLVIVNPEPASISLLLLGTALLRSRRRPTN